MYKKCTKSDSEKINSLKVYKNSIQKDINFRNLFVHLLYFILTKLRKFEKRWAQEV